MPDEGVRREKAHAASVFDPEDSVRFYALRLRGAGMIRSTPQRLIAQGTDWRFFTS